VERRLLLGLVVLSAIGGAALAAVLLLRRRRADAIPDAEWVPHYAPPVSVIAGELLADQPLARSTDEEHARRDTGYDEELDAEQERRRAAAERLKADPLDERPQDSE
jgi:uncharacterized membrane protein